MRVIYAGLSCFLLASVVACGGKSAEEGSADAGVGGDAAADDGTQTKPDEGKDDEQDGGKDTDDDSDDVDDATEPSTVLDAASPTGTTTGTSPSNSGGSGGGPGTTDDTSAGATGNEPDTDTSGAGGDSGLDNNTDETSATDESTDDDPSDTDETDPDETETDDTDLGTDSDPIDTDETDTDDGDTDDTDTDVTDTDDTDTGAGGAGPEPTVKPPIVIIPPKFEEVTIPTGCDWQADHTGADSCGASFNCDGEYFDSNCTDVGDTATCYCYGSGFDFSYVLSGLDDDELCSYPLELCRSGKLADTGPETCTTAPPQVYANDCYGSKPCTQLLDLGDGVTATKTVSSNNLSCYKNSDDEWGCSCSDNTKYENYTLTGATQQTACPSLSPVCLDGVVPTYGEAVCEDYSDGDGEGYCNVNRSCTKEAALEGGVSLTKSTNTQASCSDYGDYWYCDCYSPYYFSYTTEASLEDYCDTALNVCEADLTEIDWGSSSDDCRVSSTQVSGGSCYANVTCEWDVTLGETPVSVNGSVSMSCYPSESDEETWNCSCNNSGKSFSVPVGDVAITSCSEAAMNCASDTVPGNQGGIIIGGDISTPPMTTSSPI